MSQQSPFYLFVRISFLQIWEQWTETKVISLCMQAQLLVCPACLVQSVCHHFAAKMLIGWSSVKALTPSHGSIVVWFKVKLGDTIHTPKWECNIVRWDLQLDWTGSQPSIDIIYREETQCLAWTERLSCSLRFLG